jgi:hypothetical protein
MLTIKEPEPWGLKRVWKDMSQPYWKDLELNRDLIGSKMSDDDIKRLNLPESKTAKDITYEWTEDRVATKLELENRSVEEIAWTTGKMKKEGQWVEADKSITEPVKAWFNKRKDIRKKRREDRRANKLLSKEDKFLRKELEKPLSVDTSNIMDNTLASLDDVAVPAEDSIIPPEKFSVKDRIKKGLKTGESIKRAWDIGKQAKKALSPDDPGHKFADFMYKGNVPMKGTKLGPVRNIVNMAKDH